VPLNVRCDFDGSLENVHTCRPKLNTASEYQRTVENVALYTPKRFAGKQATLPLAQVYHWIRVDVV
jgi:hypothetical protein